MKNYLITGTTGGLGFEIAKHLAKDSKNKVIMANRNLHKGNEIARQLGDNVISMQLDLSRLTDVRSFIETWNTPLYGLINNAGVQFVNKTHFTSDTYEETIAVNHVAAFMLTLGLIPHLSEGRVLFMGSGTHNPNYITARLFGFKGGLLISLEDLLHGEAHSKNIRQMNLNRYATSKLFNTISAVELSRRYPSTSFYVFDPGLMPGTGLARQQNDVMLFLWKRILPVFRLFFPDTSSAKKSGRTAAWMMSTPEIPFPSGEIISFNRKPNKHVWKDVVYDETHGQKLFEDSMAIIEKVGSA